MQTQFSAKQKNLEDLLLTDSVGIVPQYSKQWDAFIIFVTAK